MRLANLPLTMREAATGRPALECVLLNTLRNATRLSLRQSLLSCPVLIQRGTDDEVHRLILAGIDELMGSHAGALIAGDVATWCRPPRPGPPDDSGPLALIVPVGRRHVHVQIAVHYEVFSSPAKECRLLVTVFLRLRYLPKRSRNRMEGNELLEWYKRVAATLAKGIRRRYAERLDWLADLGRLDRVLRLAPPIRLEDEPPAVPTTMPMEEYVPRYDEGVKALRDLVIPVGDERRVAEQALDEAGAAPGMRRPAPSVYVKDPDQVPDQRRTPISAQATAHEVLDRIQELAAAQLVRCQREGDRLGAALFARIAAGEEFTAHDVARDVDCRARSVRRRLDREWPTLCREAGESEVGEHHCPYLVRRRRSRRRASSS